MIIQKYTYILDNMKEIYELKNTFERYDDDTCFSFIIIDLRFRDYPIGKFDSAQLDREGKLHLYGDIPPRPVL